MRKLILLFIIVPVLLTPVSFAQDGSDFEEVLHLGRGLIEEFDISPDGELVAVASSTGIWIYDASTFELVNFLDGHNAEVHLVEWSPDGKFLASGGSRYTIIIWDTMTWDIVTSIDEVGLPFDLEWSPDGEYFIATGTDNDPAIWNTTTWVITGSLEGYSGDDTVVEVVWSPGGTYIATRTLHENEVIIWDGITWEPVQDLSDQLKTVYSLEWSSVGEQLLIYIPDTLTVWDSTTWEIIQRDERRFSDVDVSPDGTQLALARHGNLIIRDLASEQDTQTLSVDNIDPSDGYTILVVVWSPDGSFVIGGDGALLVRWNSETWTQEGRHEAHGGLYSSITWSPDGEFFTYNSGGSFHIFAFDNGELTPSLTIDNVEISRPEWSPDGLYIASRGPENTVIILDATTGDITQTLTGHSLAVGVVAWSPDGTQLVSGGTDNIVIVWDVSTGEQVHTLTYHEKSITSVAWSPDGSRIASIDVDGMLKIWNSSTGENVRNRDEGFASFTHRVAWSPDGRLLASTGNNRSIAIRSEDGIELNMFGHNSGVSDLSWSPDGAYLASGSTDDTVMIWDPDSAEAVATIRGHLDWLTEVAWSPRGDYIATASQDGTLRFWRVPPEFQSGQ